MTFRIAALACAALIAAACQPSKPPGPTNDEVIATYRDRLAAKKQAIIDVMGSLPETLTVQPVKGAVAPFKSGTGPDASDGNVAFFAAESFIDGGAGAPFSLSMYSSLANALEWTSPVLPYTPFTGTDTAEPDVAETLEEALATPFVAFYSQVKREDPVLKDNGMFTPGYIVIDLLLVELAHANVVANCRASVISSKDLSIVTDNGGVMTQELLTIAGNSDFSKQVGESLAACLKEQTGSTFAFPSY